MTMTEKERFITALEGRQPPGRVPHFELVFFLTMEAFGKPHFSQRSFGQWQQMEEKERELHRRDQARLYIQTCERFGHSAIFLHPNPGGEDEVKRLIDLVREMSGEEYFLMIHGDATYSIPGGNGMEAFSCRLVDEPNKVKEEAQRMVDGQLEQAARFKGSGLDGFALCADYCLNTGPFLSPNMFAEFVTPYLKQLIQGQRELGYHVIKHTDGNIMPILDQLVSCKPHALHSIDPQAGVDIAEVKRRYGKEVCLIGNVNCGLLDTGTDEQVMESARYALRSGMPGGGYIFSTSNCIYTGMKLSRYELMLSVWRTEGNYPKEGA